MMERRNLFLILILVFLAVCSLCFAEQLPNDSNDLGLFDLPFEEAMEMEVISVTRTKGQNVFTSPAAIYVITQEEIRRSGHQILPELFRGVPGLHVGRINANEWAISIRGFNLSLNNKLLILIDGRSIYTLRFGGVDWDMHNIPLEIIDRIEVIRGPGGSLWGANAYNGIINIITKRASDTQGTVLSVGGGSEHLLKGTGIYGGKLKNGGFFRVYGEFDKFDDFKRGDGSDGSDEWETAQTGYRFDWDKGIDSFTLQGDFHYNVLDRLPVVTRRASKLEAYANNILGKWTRTFDDESEFALLFYYDMVHRTQIEWTEERHVGDIEFQHTLVPLDGHQFVWGGKYNVNADKIGESQFLTMGHRSETLNTISGFVQDCFFLSPEVLKMTLGMKIENNHFTGFEYQPNGRLAWTPDDNNTYWASVSRAVRTPTRFEDDATIVGGFTRNPDVESETVVSFELGQRHKFTEKLFTDVAAFANTYDNLIAKNFGSDKLENVSSGEAQGVELSGTWQATNYWKLLANYSFFNIDIHGLREDNEFAFPRNMANLKSFLDINDKLELNSAMYYSDNLSRFSSPSIVRLDIGLTYKPKQNMEISVWGQNLTESQQGPEMVALEQGEILEAERAIFAKITWRF